jgi:hypothetical protein
MSRTHHHTSPDTARRRRALKTAVNSIVTAWAWNERIAKAKVRDFRHRLIGMKPDDWWRTVADLRPWLPRRRG